MSNILILYYSRSGNTEKMATAVAEGTRSTGKSTVELSYHVEAEALARFDAIILGAPTYHHDMPIDMKKLFEISAMKRINLKGKIGAAFGSFGWSGEAPKLLLEIMKNKFEMNIVAPPLLAKYTPDGNMIDKCRNLERTIAENLIP
ncbi:MAG: flavodoxin domain-containing protein [Candidatus Bathyarchaeota archaeon]|nr:flavodoxin domain-containing protein [Candidatus Bathyarchaeota archaeon]